MGRRTLALVSSLPRIAKKEPSSGRGSAGRRQGKSGLGGELDLEIIDDSDDAGDRPASLCASAETLSFGTSPASVTTPLVTLMSMFTMFEKRSTVSFALTAA